MTIRMIVKMHLVSIAALCLLLGTPAMAVAQPTNGGESAGNVPQLVKFSGLVRDDLGHVKTGMVGVTFAVYKDQDGGSPLWLETQNIEADSEGNYSTLLGATKLERLPSDLFSAKEPRWLGVQIEGQAEQPRILFVSVPYALKASDAATIGGPPPSAFLRAPAPGSRDNETAGTASSSAVTPKVSGSGTTDFLPIS